MDVKGKGVTPLAIRGPVGATGAFRALEIKLGLFRPYI